MKNAKIFDLTHPFTASMPVHSFDEPASLINVRTLECDKYNDWRLSSGMHVGTHIDGPGHLTDTRLRISDIPVDRFVGSGYLIDVRGKVIDVSLLADLPERDDLIVLILTGFDKKFGSEEYFNHHPTLSVDFAKKLAERKIKMVGIDFFSPDRYPFEVHKRFFEHGILLIENMANLETLLSVKRFTVVALPLKLEADSALARVVAIAE